jgi:hypothetical protein
VSTAEDIWWAGLRAQHLRDRYYALRAALEISRNPTSDGLLPPVQAGQTVPTFSVKQSDGRELDLHFEYFLQRSREPAIADEFDKTYYRGALLELGDLLDDLNYIDRSPPLELVRHLRNGVAHGNSFEIRDPGSLNQYPAHNRAIPSNTLHPDEFEITPQLHGTRVLFDFIGPVSLGWLFDTLSHYIMGLGSPPLGTAPDLRASGDGLP